MAAPDIADGVKLGAGQTDPEPGDQSLLPRGGSPIARQQLTCVFEPRCRLTLPLPQTHADRTVRSRRRVDPADGWNRGRSPDETASGPCGRSPVSGLGRNGGHAVDNRRTIYACKGERPPVHQPRASHIGPGPLYVQR